MPTKIRLSRHGKKGSPFYHIVIADGRAPRDGKFIEKIGTYNPNTNPAEIDLEFDKALDWIQKGAQPTDTVRAILSYSGVMHKNHLLKGVTKGALTEEQANAKFDAWMSEKAAKVAAKIEGLDKKATDAAKAKMDAEKKINEERAAEFAKRRKEAEDALVAEVSGEAEAVENAEAEIAEEVEVKVEETVEAKTEEKPAEEKPAEEKPVEEKPAEENKEAAE